MEPALELGLGRRRALMVVWNSRLLCPAAPFGLQLAEAEVVETVQRSRIRFRWKLVRIFQRAEG